MKAFNLFQKKFFTIKNKRKFVYFLLLFLIFCPFIVKADMTTGLVGYWNFDEGSGTTANDSSGNGNNATLMNGPIWTTGRVGQGLNFDGVNDYVSKTNPSWNFVGNPTKSFTVSAWFNPRTCVDLSGIALANEGGWAAHLRLSARPSLWIIQLIPGTIHADGGSCLTNQWQHVTGVYNASEKKLYLYYNGILGDSKVLVDINTSNLTDGLNVGYTQSYFDGIIDEVRVYNRALSASDILEIYNSAGAPPVPDTMSPSIPTNLAATAISYYQINLSWAASTDNVGVTGYRIYRGGTQIGTSTTTSYSDVNASPSTTYTYTVSAYDSAGNVSNQSSSASATTQAAPGGGTYYVSTTGNDSNPGTQSQPWKTMQKAANIVTTGDTVYVNAGVYAERVTISTSGNPGAMISFIANGTVECQGFNIYGNYVHIKGFKVTAIVSGWNRDAYGIYIEGDYCLIEDNYAYYNPNAGIVTAIPSNGCTIRDNRLQRNTLNGMEIDGTNHLIENNEIWDTIVYHTPTQSLLTQDSNGVQYLGSGHIFRGNYIHDITFTNPESINYHPHIDAFQTFYGGSGPASNVLFEKNLIYMPEWVEDPNNSLVAWMLAGATNITIRNNIVITHGGTETGGGGCSHIKILNNVFVGKLTDAGTKWPIGISLEEAPYSTVKNNIVYNQPGQAIYLTGTTFTGLDIGNNLVYNSDGSTPAASTYDRSKEIWAVDPKFVNPSGKDFHLQSSSPAINAGATLSDVIDDYDGNFRPQGAGYDIGAYEYVGVVTPPSDTTPPTISSVSPSVTYNSATITWTTNENSDSQVEYGLSASYGNQTTLNTSMVGSHSVLVSNLNPSTTYHYRVKSKDALNNQAISTDYTFTTSSAPTLSVSLSANPSSGTAPLSGVDLAATVTGSVTGNINYTFYCNRSDSGTNITTPYDAKYDNVSQTTRTGTDICSYNTSGTYTVKVIVERGGYQAEARTTITVSQQNYAPIGNVDGADVNHITGWAYDQNAGTSPINVHIYIDGTPTANITANLSRPDIIGAGGGVVQDANHGFDYAFQGLSIGTHTINVYAINTPNGTNPELSGSPKTVTVSAAPIPAVPTTPTTSGGGGEGGGGGGSNTTTPTSPTTPSAKPSVPTTPTTAPTTPTASTASTAPSITPVSGSSNQVLRASSDTKVYEVVSNLIHWIPNPTVFNVYGFSWSNIKVVSIEEVNKYSRVKLLRAQGDVKVYYLTEAGQIRHIPNPEIFNSYNNKWEEIIVVSQTEINSYPSSTLIRLEGGAKVYKLENGQKRWIETAEAFNRFKYDWTKIAPVNQIELNYYPEGATIK